MPTPISSGSSARSATCGRACRSAASLRSLLAFPVIEARTGAREEARELRLAVGPGKFAVNASLVGIGIVDDFGREFRANREIFELRARRGIADLVRGLGAARRTGDHIAAPYGVTLGPDDELALAFDDE